VGEKCGPMSSQDTGTSDLYATKFVDRSILRLCKTRSTRCTSPASSRISEKLQCGCKLRRKEVPRQRSGGSHVERRSVHAMKYFERASEKLGRNPQFSGEYCQPGALDTKFLYGEECLSKSGDQ
jgi:hypothetical protein